MADIFEKYVSFISTIRRTAAAALLSLAFLPSSAQEVGFVDMGVKADNGKDMLWAQGDLMYTDENVFVLLSSDQIGETFGWGDITGRAVGSALSQYGGTNPPTKICGNPKYDICTAKLGTGYRLPSCKEIERLTDNCTYKVYQSERTLPKYDSRGVPTSIYGQWMWEGGGSWHALKFDGPLVSVISSANGNMRSIYYGVYSYKDGKIVIPNLLKLTVKNGVLEAENGGYFKQVSKQTQEATVLYAELTSKINGNKLRFPISIGAPVVTSGKWVIDMSNDTREKSIGYWTGELLTMEEKQGGVFLKLSEKGGYGPQIDERYAHYRVRPVKEYVDTITPRLLREKREKEIQDSLRQVAAVKAEMRRQDSIKLAVLTENIKRTPLLSAFLETSEALSNRNFFEVKKVSQQGTTATYYVYATSNSQKAYKNFWKKVESLCDKNTYWEEVEEWKVDHNGQGYGHAVLKGKTAPLITNLTVETYSYYYKGESVRGDYKEDKNGKTYSWVRLNSTKNYVVRDFSSNEETVLGMLNLFNSQVVKNILAVAAPDSTGLEVIPTRGKGNFALQKDYEQKGTASIVPVMNVPKSSAILPIESNGFSIGTKSNRLGKSCIPFLIDERKAGAALYKVEITFSK